MSTAPVVVTAYFHPAEGKHEAVLQALADSVPAIQAEPGCELYAVHVTEPGQPVLALEKWADSAALDAHSAGSAIAALRQRLAGLTSQPTAVSVYTPHPIGNGAGSL